MAEEQTMPGAESRANNHSHEQADVAMAVENFQIRTQNGEFAGINVDGERPRTALKLLHAIKAFVESAGKNPEPIADLNNERAISQAWTDASAMERILLSIPKYLEENVASEFRLPKEKKLKYEVYRKIWYLYLRLQVCFNALEKKRTSLRQEERENQRQDHPSLKDAVFKKISRIAPVPALALLLGVTGAGKVGAAPETTVESIPNSSDEFVKTASETFSRDISGIEKFVSELENKLADVLTVGDLNDGSSILEKPLAQETPASYEVLTLPQFHLSPEASQRLRNGVPEAITANGVEIDLDQMLAANQLEYFFPAGEAQGVIEAITQQQQNLSAIRSLGGDGKIILSAVANVDGTIDVSAALEITTGFTDTVSAISLPENSVLYSPSLYVGTADRSQFGINAEPEVRAVTPEIQTFFQTFGLQVEVGDSVITETDVNTGQIFSVSLENHKYLFFSYQAHSAPGENINLRVAPDVASQALTTAQDFSLLRMGADNEATILTDGLPELSQGGGEGFFEGADGLVYYQTAAGDRWLAAKNNELFGWINEGVVGNFEATPTPGARLIFEPLIQATLQPSLNTEGGDDLAPTPVPQPGVGEPGGVQVVDAAGNVPTLSATSVINGSPEFLATLSGQEKIAVEAYLASLPIELQVIFREARFYAEPQMRSVDGKFEVMTSQGRLAELGINNFNADPEVIQRAYDWMMAYLLRQVNAARQNSESIIQGPPIQRGQEIVLARDLTTGQNEHFNRSNLNTDNEYLIRGILDQMEIYSVTSNEMNQIREHFVQDPSDQLVDHIAFNIQGNITGFSFFDRVSNKLVMVLAEPSGERPLVTRIIGGTLGVANRYLLFALNYGMGDITKVAEELSSDPIFTEFGSDGEHIPPSLTIMNV